MTSDDAGRELYSHQTPPTEWGCIIETPEGRHVRTDYARWPWSGEGELNSEHSDDYVSRIGWRLARPEPARGVHPAARAYLEARRDPFDFKNLVCTAEVWRSTGYPIDATPDHAEAQVLPGEREYAEQSEPAMVPSTTIRAALAGGVRNDDWSAEALAVADVVAERDALRRIVGEIDLALSGAVPPQETKGPVAEWEFWGQRAMAVVELVVALDTSDPKPRWVAEQARHRIAAERDGGAS